MLNRIKRIAAHLRATVATQQREIPYEWFSEAEVSEYFASLADENDFETIDKQTYLDLDAPKYAQSLLSRRSIFARQYFEYRLRCGASPEAATGFMDGALALTKHPGACEEAISSLKPLLLVQHEVASLLHRARGAKLPSIFARLRYADYIGLLACSLAMIWPSLLTIGLLGAYICFSFYIQIGCYRSLKPWTNKRDALQHLLDVAAALAAKRGSIPEEILSGALSDPGAIARVSSQLKPGALSRNPATVEYANIFFLYEYARAYRESLAVERNLSVLQDLFKSVSRAEVQVVLAQAINSGQRLCRPHPSSAPALTFDELVHPLIAEPSPLSFETSGKSLFISGKNGVGKSTLLRAVGLSLATFRAFGYAHARAASLPRVTVWSSILVDDSIEQGRSLYMSEMKRAALLLLAARSGRPVVFLLDELFRGTNYVESVSASATTLNALAASGCVLASSHNIVLATLLARKFDAIRVVGEVATAIRVERGVIAETNGVELMESYGIDGDLVTGARSICEWYSEYIAHPTAVPPELLT